MSSPLALLATALQVPAPWWKPYLPAARTVLDVRAAAVAAALETVRDATMPRFVEHSLLPHDESYEAFIARTTCIPMRDDLHDLLNGLVWLTFPRTKRRLNELQAQHIAAHGISGKRGPLRDALTVFDENAAVLQAPSDLVDALRRRQWRELFVTRRAQWSSARVVLFGHALLEKLLQPRKPVTAHVWVVDELSDDCIASSLDPLRLAAKDFLPLPVLGVPGWWGPNEDPSFYDDAAVFRPQSV